MLDYFLTFATIVGFFHTANAVVLQKHKDAVSGFIFGKRDVSVQNFEAGVISGLIGPFLKDNRLQWRKVVILSTVVAVLSNTYILVLADTATKNSMVSNLTAAITLVPFSAVLSLPFDYFSLWLTKKLFVDRRPKLVWLLPLILFDFIISAIPGIAQLNLLVLFVEPETFGELGRLYIVPAILSAIFVNYFASILITLIQFITLTLGVIIRFVFSLLHATTMIGEMSEFKSYPFTFIGFVAATIVLLF